jgi:hypothetical protein
MLSVISFAGKDLSSEKKPSECGTLMFHAKSRARATRAQKIVRILGFAAGAPFGSGFDCAFKERSSQVSPT